MGEGQGWGTEPGRGDRAGGSETKGDGGAEELQPWCRDDTSRANGDASLEKLPKEKRRSRLRGSGHLLETCLPCFPRSASPSFFFFQLPHLNRDNSSAHVTRQLQGQEKPLEQCLAQRKPSVMPATQSIAIISFNLKTTLRDVYHYLYFFKEETGPGR